MSDFKLHEKDAVSGDVKELYGAAEGKFGFVPNVLKVLAEAPAALKGYMTLSGLLGETSFSTEEQQLILLIVSAKNECEYCVAAHTGGSKGAGVSDGFIEAVRGGRPISDDRLQALRVFTETVMEKRGWLDDSDVQAFLDAGYTRQNILEVILAIAMKTISNYTNHIAETPLDEQLKPVKWDKKDAA